ncbi:MAG TPA: type II CRISPR-associated endonuclease Cas1 [Bacteroidales bacterium]|nr:type II CRISPR-associated endonuclease Cas1 [Bacteroidales bacterium]HSA43081.1 type II CRISPR-associated endonuclease Cas1 [Bacteroidales bacterium]
MIKRTIIFSNPTRISLRNGQLICQNNDSNEVKQAPIEDLGFVVLEHQQIFISLPLLNALINNNVAVIFCDDQHMPSSMLLNLEGHTTQAELFGHQLHASEPLKKSLWKQTVEAKIMNQAALLSSLGLRESDLIALGRDVKSGDTTNREGAAARIYWKRLFGRDFERDRYGSSPNHMLNYGYIILRAAVARALCGSGLLPTIGIFHHNRYNSFCLADDIMEPYRPFIDQKVFELFNTDFDAEKLTTRIKMKLLEILSADVVVQKMKRPLMVALSLTTASLARCFAGEVKKISYPALPP